VAASYCPFLEGDAELCSASLFLLSGS
jgi:hypothetical protein